jgi:apolipoprotein N-acyltransferase
MKNKTQILICLVLGSIFFLFSNGQWSFAIAAWLYPVFLLFVARDPQFKFAYLLPLLTGLICQLAFWKFTFSRPDHILFYLPFLLGLSYGLMLLLDRWIYPKIKGFVSTLFFPLLYTSFDFLLNLFNPYGTTGLLGYSQIDFLVFAQLASLTGMWGLTFMITWFGSVANWTIANWHNTKQLKQKLSIYALIFVVIILYGGIRLNLPLEKGTVRIASFHSFDKDRDGKEFWKLLAQKDLNTVRKISQKHINLLLESTRREAKAGAKIILWAESSHNILKQDEDSMVRIFKNLANELNIYLVTNPYSATTDGTKPENKILLFDPNGDLVLKHYKYGGAFIEGSVEGNKKLQTINSSYGNLAALICWDADFPSIVKQVGQQNADIMLIPASDWQEIDPLHTTVAIFRGIENGCSLVRQVRNGLSVMTDPKGKIIARSDHFEASNWVNVGQVPNRKLWTLYPIIGDLFGWLAIIGLLLIINLAKFQGTKAN